MITLDHKGGGVWRGPKFDHTIIEQPLMTDSFLKALELPNLPTIICENSVYLFISLYVVQIWSDVIGRCELTNENAAFAEVILGPVLLYKCTEAAEQLMWTAQWVQAKCVPRQSQPKYCRWLNVTWVKHVRKKVNLT